MDSTVSYHKSSAYSRTKKQPVQNSLDKAYSTIMKSSSLRNTYFDTKLLTVSTALSYHMYTWTGPDTLVIRQFLVSLWPPDYIPQESINCFQINNSHVEILVSAQVLLLYLINTSISEIKNHNS